MKKMMMKMMVLGAAALAMTQFMTGCDKTPSVEKITAVSTAIGTTAGYACELSKTKTAVKESIIAVLDVASAVVPGEGKTFVEVWTPVIEAELQKLVEAGKIDAAGAAVAKMALGVACEGIDYVFIRYPKARETKELVSAATTGFVTGFKSVVTLTAKAEKPAIDEEAYKYLKGKLEAKTVKAAPAPAPAAK